MALFSIPLHNPSWKQIYRFTPIHPLLFLNCSAPPMQSVPITTKVVSLNPDHGEVYSIQHYVIKVVSDLRWVGGFLRVHLFPSHATIYNMYNWNIFESGVKYHNDSNSNAPSSSNSWWRLYNYYQLSEFLLSVDSWMSSFSDKYMTDTQGQYTYQVHYFEQWFLNPHAQTNITTRIFIT